jgi:hypothetical protein
MVATVSGVGDFVNPGSVYLYRDKGGKIGGGPSWDFDVNFGFSWNSVPVYEIDAASAIWHYFPGVSRGNPFFKRFADDPVFMAKWKEIWNNHHTEITSMIDFIDHTAGTIRKSAIENYKVSWQDYPVDFDHWVGVLKLYVEKRIEWLDDYYRLPVPADLTSPYGQTLANVTLPAGWVWMDASVAVGAVGMQTHQAKYDGVTNLNVSVTVTKASPEYTLPAGLIATPGQTLADVALPAGWTWENATTDVGTAGMQTHKATFTPDDTKNYNVATGIDITVMVSSPTGSSELPVTRMKAWVQGGILHISGVAAGEVLSIYSITGALVYKTIPATDSIEVSLTIPGIYLILSGKERLKIKN